MQVGAAVVSYFHLSPILAAVGHWRIGLQILGASQARVPSFCFCLWIALYPSAIKNEVSFPCFAWPIVSSFALCHVLSLGIFACFRKIGVDALAPVCIFFRTSSEAFTHELTLQFTKMPFSHAITRAEKDRSSRRDRCRSFFPQRSGN